MNIRITEVVPLDLQVCAGKTPPSGYEAMYLIMIRKWSESIILVKGYA